MDAGEVEKIIKQAVDAAIEAADERNKYLFSLIEKHEHTLYGNGQEGITTTVKQLKQAVDGATKVFMAVVISLAVSGVLGLLVLLVRFNLLKP